MYRHEMPGGQYTYLREQARGLGLEARWPEVARAYAEVNQMFGDIIKVTPTSKVVGDMALFMVSNDLDALAVLDPDREIAFPQSVVSLFKGELGFPADGFPQNLQDKVLAGEAPLRDRPSAMMPPVDLEATKLEVEKVVGRVLSDTDLASSLMYPSVFNDYAAHRRKYSDVSKLPTPAFFYGLAEGQEISVELGSGKALLIELQGQTDVPEDGEVKLFFELNGQPRVVRIAKAGAPMASRRSRQRKSRRCANAGHDCVRRRKGRSKGQKGRSTAIARSHENGDADPRGGKRHDRGSVCAPRRHG